MLPVLVAIKIRDVMGSIRPMGTELVERMRAICIKLVRVSFKSPVPIIIDSPR